LFGEGVNGERSNKKLTKKTNKFSFSATLTIPLTPKTQWEFAAGSVDGDMAHETNLYHKFGKNWRGTIGYGHLDNHHHARIGLIKTF